MRWIRFTLFLPLILIFGCTPFSEDIVITKGINTNFKNGTPYITELLPVKEVTDGDSIKVFFNDELVNINFALVDSPESTGKYALRVQPFAKEAHTFTKSLIERSGSKVILVFDPVTRDQQDPQNRLFAYVYLPNGKMINEELLYQGLAKVKVVQNQMEFEDRFKRIEEMAKKDKVGLWKEG